jgi:hypothetical protein
MMSASNTALILDVPFIGWNDAKRFGLEVNPSLPASLGMAMAYWGRDPEEILKPPGDSTDVLHEWMTEKHGGVIDDLKSLITDGHPVVVAPTGLTPFAHPTNPIPYQLGTAALPDSYQITSGNLDGVFVSLDTPGLAMPGLRDYGKVGEDHWYCARVVVGYDQSARSLLLHDPTFGPHWEVGFDYFERMWAVGGSRYLVVAPPGHWGTVPAPKAHRQPRATAWAATVHYVFGYGLSSIGRNQEAEEQLRRGLELEGTGEGYRYLLLLELAVTRVKRGDLSEAMALSKKAVKLIPEHSCAWYLLANVYRRRGALGLVRSLLARWRAMSYESSRAGSMLPRNLLLAEGVGDAGFTIAELEKWL